MSWREPLRSPGRPAGGGLRWRPRWRTSTRRRDHRTGGRAAPPDAHRRRAAAQDVRAGGVRGAVVVLHLADPAAAGPGGVAARAARCAAPLRREPLEPGLPGGDVRGGHHGTGVEAWEWLTSDPERRATYKRARGKGGFVRCDWREVTELVAAAQVHAVKRHGPDRIVGSSPIPAMSYGDHTRFADDWLAAAPGTDGALAMGHGPCDSHRVPPRPAGTALHRVRQDLHRPAVPGDASGT
ncbi:Molybdopterin oxidoreductase [Streptomyces sp. MnatMP-M27]|nr:Molybdopterin oxidoreductase [Streptomyces sp. MnatMP-M27]